MDENTPMQLVDFPVKAIHRIQLFLPVEEAARTCVLSKSWSHAWSTIPTLRFPFQDKNSKTYDQLIHSTLLRYHRNNTPITSFNVKYKVTNKKSTSFFEKLIRHIASSKTTSCLKELSINLWVGDRICRFTLPDEILSIQTLTTLQVTIEPCRNYLKSLWSNPVISCVSLQVLDLQYVNVSDEFIHNLLSTCSLLEKISLYCCEGLNNIKVKNLPYLRELKFTTSKHISEILEIDQVPSLDMFHFDTEEDTCWYKSLPFDTVSLGRSVTQLHIGRVIFDKEFFDLIKRNFPLLESLTLVIEHNGVDNFVITSASMKSLTIHLLASDMFGSTRSINVQVYAPNLLYCVYKSTKGCKYPSLTFPNTPPGQIKLTMKNGKLSNNFMDMC